MLALLHSVPPTCSRPPRIHASTGNSWTLTGKSGSVSYGVTAPLSWVLVCTRFYFCPPRKSLFPHPCVSSGSSMVGLMTTSFKRAYAIPRSAAPRAPDSVAGHCWPELLLTSAAADPSLCRKHWNPVLAQSLWGSLVCTTFVWALWVSLMSRGFDSKCDFAPPTILLGLLLCPWMWGIFFFGRIQHSPVDGCSAAICNFGVLVEVECTSFYSTWIFVIL